MPFFQCRYHFECAQIESEHKLKLACDQCAHVQVFWGILLLGCALSAADKSYVYPGEPVPSDTIRQALDVIW